MRKYLVVRIANKADSDIPSVPVSALETLEAASKEFYRLCGQAVDSQWPIDAVLMMTNRGDVLDKKVFDHQAEQAAEE